MDALARRARTRAAISAVVSNTDLVRHILRGNVGASTLVAASAVSRAFLEACDDESVVKAAALYAGRITKGILIRLFCLSNREADALPHTTHDRRGGGFYFLFGKAAISKLLAARGWRSRLRANAHAWRSSANTAWSCGAVGVSKHGGLTFVPPRPRYNTTQVHAGGLTFYVNTTPSSLLTWQEEEQRHARMLKHQQRA